MAGEAGSQRRHVSKSIHPHLQIDGRPVLHQNIQHLEKGVNGLCDSEDLLFRLCRSTDLLLF